jgi:hypothetical protein
MEIRDLDIAIRFLLSNSLAAFQICSRRTRGLAKDTVLATCLSSGRSASSGLLSAPDILGKETKRIGETT